jgi:Sugar phosphate isomerases/epimerases
MDHICVDKSMTVFDWIQQSTMLGAEGLEMYEGFFESLDDVYIDSVGEAIRNQGYAMPMLCCSPDFTNPDPDGRKRAVEHEIKMMHVTKRLGGAGAACRVLSGQRYPNVSREQGVEWVVEAITGLLPIARELDIVLAMENHYKDGYWKFVEFAQKADVFIDIIDRIPDRTHFGVQFDPSNNVVAGEDPVEFLKKVVDRVVTMHASDRFLAPGATLEDVNIGDDGLIGYPDKLRHGVVGQGMNDFNAIFSILAKAKFRGWVSIEDGMNGMDDMKQSIDFLKAMRDKYFTA